MTTVLITGANRGLGLEFVRQYNAEGATVIACCRDPRKADAILTQGIEIVALDVGNPDSIAALADALKGRPIDIVINNAGVFGPDRQSGEDCDYEAMVETFRINALAPLMIAKALKPNLLAGGEKKLAVVSSKMGSITDSTGGYLAYRASKAAVNMIFNGLAKEWKKFGVAVLILNPGWVHTDMGGPKAPTSPTASIKGMKARIAELTLNTTGQFRDFQGAEIPW